MSRPRRPALAALRSIATGVALCCMLTSCWVTSGSSVSAINAATAAKEREIAALRADYSAQMEALRTEEAAKRAAVVASKDAQLVGAASAFYGQDYVFKSISRPTRTDIVWHNLTLEGWQATGNLMPALKAMQEMQERLLKDLDETRTSLTDLQTTHAAAMAENQQLAEATKRFEAELAALEAKRTAAERAFNAQIIEKQAALTDLQKHLNAVVKASADADKARQAQLARLSWASGVLAALCLAGAIWSPISKRELAIAAATFAGAAVAIPFLEGWHVLVGVGLALATLVVWALIKHHRKERATDALSLAVQDLREKGGEIAAAVEATVADRTARYRRTKDGTMVAERDPAIEREIQTTLADYDALPAKPAA